MARDEERTRVGYVTRIVRGPAGDLSLALRLYPGAPRTLALRTLSSAFNEEPPMPGILLAETPEEPSTLIIGSRMFTAGRMVRSVSEVAFSCRRCFWDRMPSRIWFATAMDLPQKSGTRCTQPECAVRWHSTNC